MRTTYVVRIRAAAKHHGALALICKHILKVKGQEHQQCIDQVGTFTSGSAAPASSWLHLSGPNSMSGPVHRQKLGFTHTAAATIGAGDFGIRHKDHTAAAQHMYIPMEPLRGCTAGPTRCFQPCLQALSP